MVKRNLLDQRDNPQLLKLWEDYQADDKLEARNALVEHYRPFAAMVARKLKTKLPRSVDYGDLESAADVGLIQSIQKYDPSRGVPFEAFCSHRVRGAIIDELRRHDWVSRPMRSRLNTQKQVVDKLRSTLEREPTEPEIAEALGIDLEEYHRTYGGGRDAPLLAGNKLATEEDDGNGTLDFYEDPREEAPEASIHASEMLEMISQALNPEDREILYLRFFLNYSLKEIGDIYNLSQSRVSKILGRITDRLKVRFEERI
jgi:RNA polymerase sigma factor for flagellar operon FliA